MSTANRIDWNSLGFDVDCIICKFLDFQSLEALSKCSRRLHARHLGIVPRAMPSAYNIKYVECKSDSQGFELKPISTLNVCNLYSMFRGVKLKPIQDTWFKLQSISKIRKTELATFIKNDHSKHSESENKEFLYCDGWENIKIASDGRIAIRFVRANELKIYNAIHWKYTPSKLTNLQLNGCNLSFDAVLKYLNLSNNLLSGDIMKDIIEILPNSIVDLNLCNNQLIGTINFNVIGRRLPSLQSLSLHYNQIENITNVL